jgi:cobalt-precorrin 5A hydrolase/precorrin-3B C17-methyltransferase
MDDLASRDLAYVCLTEAGAATARRLQAALGGELHGREGRVAGPDVAFAETTAHLRTLFKAGRPLVAFCAAGVPIRALAPLLGDKRGEPAVLAVAEDGSAVVPLLGGHRGANALAEGIAQVLGVAAAVTTAGDLRFGVALDDPPSGWTLANPQHAKAAAAALLAGASARLEGDLPWLRDSGLPLSEDGVVALAASLATVSGTPDRLVYRPQVLVLGVGCARGCPPEELDDLVRTALDEAGLAPEAIALVASLDLKADEPAVLQLAARLGRPARFFEAAALEAETPRLANPSDTVFAEVGCHGVAEAAALAAAGPEGSLRLEKRKSANATCALALAPRPIVPAEVGRARGRLAVVGIGPGTPEWRTPAASRLIAEASDLVAYGLYLDLLGPPRPGQRHHRFDLGDEEARAEAALKLAAEGRDVALVSSGDAGIYAMAAVVYELLDRHAGRHDDVAGWWDAARRAEILVTPGISALQAAAARLGAPLGHDFCAISLSDLLTPWETIRQRVAAAAAGDFVVAFYNPVSKKRDWQLGAARDLLLERRPAETPVALASNLGRPSEAIRLTTLGALDPAEVDMLTLVLVGSSQTRAVARGDGGAWVYTPRGYAAKQRGEAAE